MSAFTIRHATAADLPAIVSIYNASIPGRLATADTEPVSVQERRSWFESFTPGARPLWVAEVSGQVAGWLSLKSFYGRPAYHRTVEVGVYVDPGHRRLGTAATLLDHALGAAPSLGIATLLAFVFAHNAPSVDLFRAHGFEGWGLLPRVADLDGLERDLAILGRRVGQK